MEDDTELGLDPSAGDWFDEELEKGVMEPPRPPEVPIKAKKKKERRLCKFSSFDFAVRCSNYLQGRPHVFWKDNHRQAYLDEVLRWEGRVYDEPDRY